MFTEKSSKILVWIGIILIILALFMFQNGEHLFQWHNEIKSDKIGQLGDFVGGVIGSLWSLAGVFLFYIALNKQIEALEDQKKSTEIAINSLNLQSNELQLQRTELHETRKEFLLNRITNIVYLQLERFEKSLNEFTVTYNKIEYRGHNAISVLDRNELNSSMSLFTEHASEDLIKEFTIEGLKILGSNQSEIEKFAINAYNSVTVIERLIYKSDLEIEHLMDIKNLFFDNIGFITMGVIERISELHNNSIKYLKAEDYDNGNLKVGSMGRADIFLSSIKDFYNVIFTTDNFEQLKREWIIGRGNRG